MRTENRVHKIAAMLAMQEKLNCKTKGQFWRDEKLNWNRAVWTEAAELIDAIGWKWWKLQNTDMRKVHGEMADIWHFLLSAALQKGDAFEDPAEFIFQRLFTPQFPSYADPRMACEQLVAACLSGAPRTRLNSMISCFGGLMESCSLSFDELHRGYIGKNILNEFRQQNGYADGLNVVYRRTWSDGRDDNEHLTDVLSEVDFDSPGLLADILLKLENRYVFGEA